MSEDDPLFEADDGATPLTADERQGLIPTYITLRRELNARPDRDLTPVGLHDPSRIAPVGLHAVG